MQVEEFTVPGINSAMLYGESAFISFRSTKGKVAHYGEHIERLVKTCEYLDFDTDSDFWDEIQDELLKYVSTFPQHYFRTTVYSTLDGGVDFFIWVKFLGDHQNETVKLKTFEVDHPLFLSEQKVGQYAPIFHIGRKLNRDYKDFNEFLLINKKKEIFEAATSNFFCVKNNKLISPSFESGVYKGIFISSFIRDLEENRLKREIKDLTIDEIISEGYSCFVCNSVRGIRVVTQIDETTIECKKEDADFINRYLKRVEGYDQIVTC